ncbi:MAG TPA: DNA topoisomerase VI subunit B [Phycisphaerae bacterium]|nr:DNA topoisomerase VI subunit B [Phycisphaerae bacterium]
MKPPHQMQAERQTEFAFSGATATAKPGRRRAPGGDARSSAPKAAGTQKARGSVRVATAETMAREQRDISVSEFFAKNRHLLGFDNRRKSLLTTVKEAVDNSLDACEEAGILPDLEVRVAQTAEDRFKVVVRDNGPGVVRQQVPNIFGKLLYGSKFHRLKMSRGQQGIGISAAGMYGLITTGTPISVVSRTGSNKLAHHFKIAIDTKKNRPEVVQDEEMEVEWPHGTRVEIHLVASHAKGRQSIDEYLDQTAIANPHAHIRYTPPAGEPVDYTRAVEELPAQPREIKPHPHGIELGILMKMLKETSAKKVGAFLQKDFSRVSSAMARRVCAGAGITPLTWVNAVDSHAAERLYNALQKAKLKAPSTDCLVPIGAEAILSGLLKEVKAEFYTASTRSPAVYRGNPFQIEVGLAYGGELGPDPREQEPGGNGRNARNNQAQARVIRFANRVPLLYQQSGCCMFKAILDTKWNNYGLSQARGALPAAPMVILVHMASVWVPFTSESKEAIADYDEIRKEIKLAIAECGRRLATLLRRKKTRTVYANRRDVFTRYIGEVVDSVRAITTVNKETLRQALASLAEHHTAHADMELDDHGRVIKKADALEHTVVVDRSADDPAPETLFEADESKPAKTRKRASAKRKTAGRPAKR